jgi:hypothetical protein
MRVLIAVLSLWAVAVLALRGDKRYRFDEVDEREVEAFRVGKTFRYPWTPRSAREWPPYPNNTP